jgi:CheY-like chemotaxis protein
MKDHKENTAWVIPGLEGNIESVEEPQDSLLLGTLKGKKNGRVLVVDDSKAIRDSLYELLSLMGYEVVVASSGHEALNRFLKGSFEVVLTDLEMPGIDGDTLAFHIKDRSSNTRVVLMTGSRDVSVMEKAKKSFIDAVMLKPFRLEDLVNELSSPRGASTSGLKKPT